MYIFVSRMLLYLSYQLLDNNGTLPEATTSTSADSAEVKDVKKKDYIKGGATGKYVTCKSTMILYLLMYMYLDNSKHCLTGIVPHE